MRLLLTGQARYVPDLKKMIGQCTFNYVQILRLFPRVRQFQKDDQIRFHLLHSQGAVVTCTVTEAAPYTTFLTFSQKPQASTPRASHGDDGHNRDDEIVQGLSLLIRVRLYHDAQLAEVVDAQRGAVLPGRFPYPNPRMFQADEKAQSNRFFGEWLEYCRKHGLAILPDSGIYC